MFSAPCHKYIAAYARHGRQPSVRRLSSRSFLKLVLCSKPRSIPMRFGPKIELFRHVPAAKSIRL
jgi:hypothetical protein